MHDTSRSTSQIELTFSVIICTHNRSHYLTDAIASVREQTYPSHAYQIIVVDNASTDDTARIIRELGVTPGPVIRYVYDPELGIAHARNTGAYAADSDIIAFADDDILADPQWLTALAQSFTRDEQVVCVSGRIELQWDSPRPGWLADELEPMLGSTRRLGKEPRLLSATEHPFAGNMAVRRSAVAAVGGFDPTLGHVGTKLGGHEETRFSDLLRNFGKIVYAPDALVWHRVLPGRTRRVYFLRRGYAQGMADANLAQMSRPRSRSGLLRTVAANLLCLGGDFLRVVITYLRGCKKDSFAQLVFTASRGGRLVQTARLAVRSS